MLKMRQSWNFFKNFIGSIAIVHWKLFKSFGFGAIPIIQLRESLIKDSQLTQNYLVLIFSSCLIATFGLVINSTAVIIGAMIIAHLMLPLRGFSFATLEGDWQLLRNSFISVMIGSLIAVICSYLVGITIVFFSFASEVTSRTQPTLIDLLKVDLSISEVINNYMERRDIKVIHSEVNLQNNSPSVLLRVRAIDPVTPEEVARVEEQLSKRLRKPLKVVFEVTPSIKVKSSTPAKQ